VKDQIAEILYGDGMLIVRRQGRLSNKKSPGFGFFTALEQAGSYGAKKRRAAGEIHRLPCPYSQ
jgi:hypothetical protein